MTFDLTLFRSRFEALIQAIRQNLDELDAAGGQLRQQVRVFCQR